MSVPKFTISFNHQFFWKLDYDEVACVCHLFSQIIFRMHFLRLKVFVDAGYNLASQRLSRLRQVLLGKYPITIRFVSISSILFLIVLCKIISIILNFKYPILFFLRVC